MLKKYVGAFLNAHWPWSFMKCKHYMIYTCSLNCLGREHITSALGLTRFMHGIVNLAAPALSGNRLEGIIS